MGGGRLDMTWPSQADLALDRVDDLRPRNRGLTYGERAIVAGLRTDSIVYDTYAV